MGSSFSRRTCDKMKRLFPLQQKSRVLAGKPLTVLILVDSDEKVAIPPTMKRQDRPHQREAIRACKKGFETSRRGQVVMACGTGKTHVGMRVAEVMGADRILILVPTLALVSQFIKDWKQKNEYDKREIIAVCSDSTVAIDSDDDDLSTKQLIEMSGVIVTTDPDLISDFLNSNSSCVVFCTYASSDSIEAAQRRGNCPAFDIAICDEAHRCASRLESLWSTVVREDAIKIKNRLFMTATQRIMEVHDHDAELVASMDDVQLFGEVFYRLGFADAIRCKLLCDYRVIVTVVTDKEVERLISNDENIKLGKEDFKAKELAIHVTVDKAIREHKIKKLITFHSRIDGAKDFSHKHQLVSHLIGNNHKVWTNHINAKSSGQERLRILKDFETQPYSNSSILTNARCLTEGIDVPAVDGVVFVDPRESVISITQAIGRAMRKSRGKKIGTIIVPVFAKDSVMNQAGRNEVWDHIFEDKEFQTVKNVLFSLRMVDEGLDTIFSKISEKKTNNTKKDGDILISPRYVSSSELEEGIKNGEMIEAPEGDCIVDHIKRGRVCDKEGREIVVRIPEKIKLENFNAAQTIVSGVVGNNRQKIITGEKFSEALSNRVVKWRRSSQIAVIPTTKGLVSVGKSWASKQQSYVVVLSGPKDAISILLPRKFSKSKKQTKVQISPPTPASLLSELKLYIQEQLPIWCARASGDIEKKYNFVSIADSALVAKKIAESNCKPSSLFVYDKLTKKIEEYFRFDSEISSLSKEIIKKSIDKMIKDGLSSNYIRALIGAFRRILAPAVECGDISFSIFKNVGIPISRPASNEILTSST